VEIGEDGACVDAAVGVDGEAAAVEARRPSWSQRYPAASFINDPNTICFYAARQAYGIESASRCKASITTDGLLPAPSTLSWKQHCPPKGTLAVFSGALCEMPTLACAPQDGIQIGSIKYSYFAQEQFSE
jgi:hypothetical protein